MLIPCFNAERYLPALQKQIEALHPKFDEVILVDDGSTDRTVEKGRGLGLKIEPLGANRGPGAARNAAVKKTNAEYIHFHDADDVIASDYLAKTLPLVEEGVDVVLCSCDYIDEKTGLLIMQWRYEDSALGSDPVKCCLKKGVISVVSLIRRSTFLTAGGFNEVHRCWEDADMHFRMALVGAKFRSVPDVLCKALRHERGASKSKLYCHQCRLEFLKEYAGLVPRVPTKELVDELILTATRLFMERDKQNCDKALNLALCHGWLGPDSNNLVIKALSRIPSQKCRKTLFFMQMRARGAHKTREAS